MTTLIDRGVGGTGMDPSTIKLGTFFSYALGTKNDVFQQKISSARYEKSHQTFYCSEKFGIFP